MATIDAIARNHLRLPNNAPVPDSYVLVLEKFLKAYPDDLNFIIHRAFSGSVLKCLEVGCEGVALNMGRQSGQSAGCIATLEPYKQHIRTHPTHTISRNNRIRRKSGSNMDMRGSVAPGRVIAILDDTFTRQPSLSPPRPTTSNYLVRKRASDPVCIEISDSDSESPPAKRPRIDSSLKQPLGDVDRNTPMVSLDADPKSGHQTPSRLNTVPGYNPLIGEQAIDAHAYIPGGYVNQVNGSHRPLNLIVPVPSLWPHEEDSGDALYDSGSDGPEDFSQRQGNLIMPGPVSGFSSRGDWYGRGAADESILGPYQPREVPTARLADQRIKNFLEHYDQESFGGQKTVQDGLVALNLPELGATLPGMQTALLAHQVIGVSWMLQREREDAKWARGGILADAMGLGKTVQSIGVICANPSTDPGCAATLIVAPLALLEQWKQEISWKCEEGTFNVLIYHGPNRPKNKHEIMKYDIVLTTYHTLGNEWETEKKTRKGKKSDEGSVNDEGTEDRTTKKRKVGPLMDIHWYRVILDEAQFIRNPRTKASSIVTHLIADIKWCLTGTPFTNGLKDVFGFLRFIEHNPFADWDRFRGLIRGHEDEHAAKNVQQALAGVLFRRTKESKLDGKPIITLPPRNESWHTLEFQPEERQIYDFVEKKLQAVFNRFLQAGTVLKNYSELLVMLMRLRQICVHPCLLKAYETAYEIADTRDENDKKVIEEAARLVSNEFVALVKKNLREIALERIQNEKLKGDNATVEDNCSICFEPFNGDTVVTAPCAHSFCRVCIEAHITRPRDEADNKYHDHERDCPLCRQTISLNLLFNRRPFEPTDAELDINRSNDHVDSFSWEVDESGQGRYKARMQKKKAKKPVVDNYSDLDDFIVDDDEEEDCATYTPRSKQTQRLNNGKAPRVVISDDEDDEKPAVKSIRKENDDVYEVSSSESDDELDKLARRKSLAIQRAKTKLTKKNKPTIVVDSDEDEDANGSEPLTGPKSKKPFDPMDRPEMMSSFLPSTKMQYMMGYLEDVERENPDDKTMIVSQWTSALDLCSDYLSERGIRYIRYQGNMNSRERSDAINTFMTKGSVKVMLMSVRCGGVGLNITRACRVISLDPSWNAATDQQCFDRVHRLGQTKEVFIERLMINNTVETRVRDIQIRKQGLSDAALGEGNYQRVRFTVGELASLFGLR